MIYKITIFSRLQLVALGVRYQCRGGDVAPGIGGGAKHSKQEVTDNDDAHAFYRHTKRLHHGKDDGGKFQRERHSANRYERHSENQYHLLQKR